MFYFNLFFVVVFQNKCIEDLGCFYTGPPFFHPIDRPISLTPTSNLKVHFLLYTPNNPQEPEDLDTTPKSIKESSFNPKYPLKVLIHGFRTELDENDVRFVRIYTFKILSLVYSIICTNYYFLYSYKIFLHSLNLRLMYWLRVTEMIQKRLMSSFEEFV